MTPKQKQLKIETIKSLITTAGFKIDHYGNYKASLADREYRIKLKKVNIRIESKSPGGQWHKIISQPIVAIDLPKLAVWFGKFMNQSAAPTTPSKPVITFSQLILHSEHHYPKDYKYPDCKPFYVKTPESIFNHLKSLIPTNSGSCTFNKVLWIIDQSEDVTTGIYQHDDNYYLVSIKPN